MSTYAIGLAGDLGHLRPHLETAGFNPYGGSFSHAVTTQISELLDRAPKTPVLAAPDPADPQWAIWLSTLLDCGVRVVILGEVPAGVFVEPSRRVSATDSLAEALLACGASASMVPAAFSGIALAPPSPRPANSEDDTGAVPPTADPEPPPGPRRWIRAAGPPPTTPGATVSDPTPDDHWPAGWPSTSQLSADAAVFGVGPDPAVADKLPVSVDAIFERRTPGRSARSPHALAEVVIVFGGRGGLGKTTLAQAVAATGADHDLRTVLVDTNREQGDQHLLLRLDGDRLIPSAYETARSGRPADAIASPDLLNELRGARRDRVRFALVAAPPDTIPGSVKITTPAVYRSIIDHCVRLGDLVVIDTAAVSASLPGEMVTDLLLPLLRGGAWGLGLTDSSIPGLRHLERTLDYLIEAGVPQDRLMTVMNRVPTTAGIDMDMLGGRLSRRSTWIGPVLSDDEEIPNRSNSGVLLNDVHVLVHRLEQILNRVCDLEMVTAPPDDAHRHRLFGLLGLLKGRVG